MYDCPRKKIRSYPYTGLKMPKWECYKTPTGMVVNSASRETNLKLSSLTSKCSKTYFFHNVVVR